MEVSLVFKGRTECVALAEEDTATTLFVAAERVFSLADQNIKLLCKGKKVERGASLDGLRFPLKIMVMATGKKEVSAVVEARSDPTVRGFQSEDALGRHHAAQQTTEELSIWARPQHHTYRFCRFEPCTWQSFGHRPSSQTPHAFEARQLMLKLAQDPAVSAIMAAREWTVGLLAELDPIDDRHAEKMEGEGKRLLGYNTNAGAQIHIRLRTEDLSGFLPYPALIDTLLHELAHNEVGPHNEQFWHLFCQLKADYLRHLLALSARGELCGGKSPITLANAAAETADVRAAVLAA